MLLKLLPESAFNPLNNKTNTSHLKLVLSNFIRDVSFIMYTTEIENTSLNGYHILSTSQLQS